MSRAPAVLTPAATPLRGVGFTAPHPDAAAASLRLPVLGAAAVAVAWMAAPFLGATETLRPATAVAAVLAAIVALGITARHTAGRERTGWLLAMAGSIGAMLPAVGSVAGIVLSIGVLLIAGGGWLSDRHRALDGAVAFFTMMTAAVAYLYPEVLALSGVRRVDGVLAVNQIVLAFSCIVLMTYRCRAGERPDAWLVAIGFVIGTCAGIPGLVDSSENHASAWIPTTWWEIALPFAAILIVAGARLRTARAERILDATGSRSEPNAGLVGDLCLGAVVVALVAAPPVTHWSALPFLLMAIILRHVRSRIVEQDNERLAREAAEAAEHRLALYRASFVALTSAIEARDGYTAQHSEETVELVERVARALDLDADEISEIKTVALLHDVGKIGIPDEVLHKTGPLDEREWQVMRRHPEIGERILGTVPGLEAVALAVRHEHERWDGGGYPDGIGGPSIPLASRIVLVCDAFHAMTSNRPYRRRMSDDDALSELRRCAGTQFDPCVVDALVRALGR